MGGETRATVVEVALPKGGSGFWGIAETDSQRRPIRFHHLKEEGRDLRNYRIPQVHRDFGPYLPEQHSGEEPRDPKERDRIVFISKSLYVAGLWTYEAEWNRAADDFNRRKGFI